MRCLPHPAPAQRILGLGSNDLCLELLITHFQQHQPGHGISFASVGSLAGLLALARGEVHFAAAHLYDPDADDYNAPMLRELAPGRAFDLITLVPPHPGSSVPRGNPRKLYAIKDLAGPGIRLINRQRGAGTRLLLDQMLQRAGLDGSTLAGYDREAPTHTGVAACRRLGFCRRRARHPGGRRGL